MKRAQIVRLVGILFCLGFLSVSASKAQQAEQPLDNQAIIAMVKAHVPEENIVTQIQISPGRYSLTSSNIIHLVQAGVPMAVIAAMQAKSSGQLKQNDAGSHGVAATERPAVPMAGKWQIHDSVDPMTDRRMRYAEASVAGTPSGRFTVKATCSDDSMLNFVFVNKSKDQTLLRSHQTTCVDMKLRVLGTPDDRSDAKDVSSQYCELPDVTVINFIGNSATISRRSVDQTEAAMKAMLGGIPTPQVPNPEELPKIEDALDRMLRSYSDMATEGALNASGVPRMRDVIGASSMRVGFPFTDGSFSVIRLDLQQFEFQNYVRSCVTGESDLESDDARDVATDPNASYVPGDPRPASASLILSDKMRRAITADELQKFLPDILHKIAESRREPAPTYDAEIPVVMEVVRSCARYIGHTSYLDDCNLNTALDISEMARASKGRPSGSSAKDLLMKIYTTMTSGDWPTDGGPVISFAIGDFKSPAVREIDVKIAPQGQRQPGPLTPANTISAPAQSVTVNAPTGR